MAFILESMAVGDGAQRKPGTQTPELRTGCPGFCQPVEARGRRETIKGISRGTGWGPRNLLEGHPTGEKDTGTEVKEEGE